MSTATTARPVGDNEFPVLLRLPDLNAPLWLPPPAATQTTSPVATPALATLPSMWSLPLESSLSATLPTPVPSLATSSIDVTAPVATPAAVEATTTTTVSATPREERAGRAERSTPGQWTLIRQLATGGVLVGGLALTYFMIMGSGDDGTPSHVPTAASTLEPPVIVTPAHDVAHHHQDEASKNASPTNVTPDRSSGDVASVPPPPDFSRELNTSPALPPHIVVAEAPKREAGSVDTFKPSVEGPAFGTPAPVRENVGQFQGRIGPDASANAPSSYPTTDPTTFLYRVDGGGPGSEAARTARLNGTIAPPPLR